MDGEEIKCLLNGEGSVRTLTDANAQVANSYDYDSFGRRLSAVEAVPQPYGWKAREFIPGPDIYYNRARFYDPVLGRFISEDPLGYEGGDTNLYAFTWNNPRNWSDPSGLSSSDYAGMAGGTVVNLTRGRVIQGTIGTQQRAAALQKIKDLAAISRIAVRIACNLFIASSAMSDEGGVVDQENCSVAPVMPKAKPMPDQRQAEYEKIKGYCYTPPQKDDEGLCSYLSKMTDRMKSCADRYQRWDDKWLPGRHDEKISGFRKQVDRLKRKYKEYCESK